MEAVGLRHLRPAPAPAATTSGAAAAWSWARRNSFCSRIKPLDITWLLFLAIQGSICQALRLTGSPPGTSTCWGPRGAAPSPRHLHASSRARAEKNCSALRRLSRMLYLNIWEGKSSQGVCLLLVENYPRCLSSSLLWSPPAAAP